MVLHFLTGFPIWPDDCGLAIGMKPMVVKECNVWLAPIYIYINIIYIQWATREVICILTYFHILNIKETISDTLVTHPQYLQPWHSLQYAYIYICISKTKIDRTYFQSQILSNVNYTYMIDTVEYSDTSTCDLCHKADLPVAFHTLLRAKSHRVQIFTTTRSSIVLLLHRCKIIALLRQIWALYMFHLLFACLIYTH